MSEVILLSSPRVMGAVRNAVNERAKQIGASDDKRRRAVARAFLWVRSGHSAAWAVSEACRELSGKPPAVHHGYPNPPAAA